MGSPLPATGAWYALSSMLRSQQYEFDTWRDIIISDGGLSCPRDGEPLSTPPSTDAGAGVVAYCRYCGWRAPRDTIAPVRGAPMGHDG
jgi:hypothetical protein